MAIIDLHNKPFDETTIAKLEIFEDYAQAWIPTFVMQGRPEIHIFDFFAGTGFDLNGIPGSPIRLLGKIKEHIGNIFKYRVRIILHLNEFEPNKNKQLKFELLRKSCSTFLENNPDVRRAIQIEYYNEDFEQIFPKLLNKIKTYPSLVYLDQNGIRFLSDKYFLELEKCKETDFLYFVSSSYFWRFGNHEAFKMHLNIDIEEAKKDPYKFIHRNVLKELRKRLPKNTPLKLYPYSLQKGANIHGIIFGASHPRAVDKFLTVSWKRNELNGEANFDINSDKPELQLNLFGHKPSKIELFQEAVKMKVLNQEIANNCQLYDFTINNGHIGKHSSDCLKKLKKENKIQYDGRSPLVTYDNVYKNKIKVEYKLVGNE